MRVQDPIRKIDVQFTTRLRVSVPEWKAAVSSEDALARHRKEYPKLHDMLGRIEVIRAQLRHYPYRPAQRH